MDGLWDRGVSGAAVTKSLQNTCPRTGFTEAKDIRFFPWGFKTRQGYSSFIPDAFFTNLRQIIQYNTNNPTTGAVISGQLVVNNNLLHDTSSPTPATPILGLTSSNDYINIITIYGRIYITIHNLLTGVSSYTYVYVPASGVTARIAGGTSPALGIANFASSGTVGNVTQGVHVFGIASESDTGHISLILSSSVGGFNLLNLNQQVTATNLPLGAAGTVKRYIIGSRVIAGYSGDPTDYELFFIPGAVLNDNVTTTLTFNFTDESLVDSADYLYDLLPQVSSGVGFCWYSNRLVAYGLNTTLDSVGPSVLRLSDPGKPESFNTISGFVEVFKDDGENGIKNCFEQDGLLVICKSNKTYVTRDNGDDPNTWQVAAVDYTIGSTAFGVTKALDTTGSSKSGKTVVAGKSGAYLFQGQYTERPLTWKIARRWQKISEDTSYPAIQILDVPQAKLLLISVGDTSVSNTTYWFVGDYSLGLSWDKIRWSEWHPANAAAFMTLHNNTTLYFVDASAVGSNAAVFSMTIGSEDADYNNIIDNGSRISNCEVITSEIKFDDNLNLYQISQLRVRGKSVVQGEFSLTLEMGDDSFSAAGMPTPPLVPNTASPSPEIIKGIINFSGYYPRARFTWAGQLLEVRHMIFFGEVTAQDKLTA
jgi:hypothetical protein